MPPPRQPSDLPLPAPPSSSPIREFCAHPWPRQRRPAHLLRQTLEAGQRIATDPPTGSRRSLYAACPSNGAAASPRHRVREPNGRLAEVVTRCARGGHEFVASIDRPLPKPLVHKLIQAKLAELTSRR